MAKHCNAFRAHCTIVFAPQFRDINKKVMLQFYPTYIYDWITVLLLLLHLYDLHYKHLITLPY